MKSKSSIIALLGIMALLGIGIFAWAQQNQGNPSGAGGWMGNGCCMGSQWNANQSGGNWDSDNWMGMPSPQQRQDMMNRMHGMGMTQPMMLRCRMMMQANLAPTDPDAILALRNELSLSDDQVSRLQQIAEKARQEAASILNDQQQKTIHDLASTPGNMMQIWGQMGSMMKNMPNPPKGQNAPMMMCPMMMMMATTDANSTGTTQTRP